MGLFLYTFLFPGGEEEACRAALEREADDPDLNIRLDECRWHMFPKGPAVLLSDGAVGFDSAGRLSEAVNCPVMGLYMYDGDFWGYDLWQRGRQLDQFASLPGYFDEDSPPNMPGNAQVVAHTFGVEPERVERYLVPWDEETMDGDIYAYDEDKTVVGDSWQMADLMNALGFDFDRFCPPDETLDEEPKKEANRSASVTEGELRQEYARKQSMPIDTPELPDALNSRYYAL